MCVDMCIYVHTGYIVSYSVKLHDLRAYVLVMPACDYPATSVELLAGRFSKLQSTWIERKNPTSFFPSGLGRSSASNPKHVWVRDPRQVRGPEPLPAAWRAPAHSLHFLRPRSFQLELLAAWEVQQIVRFKKDSRLWDAFGWL